MLGWAVTFLVIALMLLYSALLALLALRQGLRKYCFISFW